MTFWKMSNKCDETYYFGGVFLSRAPGVEFGLIFHGFWDHYGDQEDPKSGKAAIRKPIQKMSGNKRREETPGRPGQGGWGSLKSTQSRSPGSSRAPMDPLSLHFVP